MSAGPRQRFGVLLACLCLQVEVTVLTTTFNHLPKHIFAFSILFTFVNKREILAAVSRGIIRTVDGFLDYQ